MNIKTLIAVSIGITLFLSTRIAASDEQGIEYGAKVYNENCARCHQPRPADHFSSQDWSVVISHMRAKARLTGKEAQAVKEFLSFSLAQVTQGDNQATDKLTDGSAIIAKYGCKGCHIVDGIGGTLGPDLNASLKLRGVDFITQKILDPKFNNSATAMPKFYLSENEITAILQYLEK